MAGCFWKDLDSSVVQASGSVGSSRRDRAVLGVYEVHWQKAKVDGKREFGRLALLYEGVRRCNQGGRGFRERQGAGT